MAGAGENGQVFGILPPEQLSALTIILRERIIGGYVAAIAISTTVAVRELARNSEARRMLLKNPEAARVVIVGVILGLSVAAAMGPGRPFYHYAFLFLWPLALLAGLAWSLESSQSERARPGRWRRQNVFGVLSVLCIGVVALSARRTTYDPEVTGVESVFSAGQLLAARNSRPGRMLVWGCDCPNSMFGPDGLPRRETSSPTTTRSGPRRTGTISGAP